MAGDSLNVTVQASQNVCMRALTHAESAFRQHTCSLCVAYTPLGMHITQFTTFCLISRRLY